MSITGSGVIQRASLLSFSDLCKAKRFYRSGMTSLLLLRHRGVLVMDVMGILVFLGLDWLLPQKISSATAQHRTVTLSQAL